MDDLLEVVRGRFSEAGNLGSFDRLRRSAQRLERREAERAAAISVLRERSAQPTTTLRTRRVAPGSVGVPCRHHRPTRIWSEHSGRRCRYRGRGLRPEGTPVRLELCAAPAAESQASCREHCRTFAPVRSGALRTAAHTSLFTWVPDAALECGWSSISPQRPCSTPDSPHSDERIRRLPSRGLRIGGGAALSGSPQGRPSHGVPNRWAIEFATKGSSVVQCRARTRRMPWSMASMRTGGSCPVLSTSHARSTSSSPIGTATESSGSPVTTDSRRTLPANPAQSTLEVRGTTWTCHTSTESTSCDDTTTQG